MTKSKVRCWCIQNWRGKDKPDDLYISYPESNSGYNLISCLNCGHVYAASVIKQVYIGPDLTQKLSGMVCVECGSALIETAAPYPEKYLSQDGVVSFSRSTEMFPDDDSVVVIFDEIYS